jgi:hypothetical protein
MSLLHFNDRTITFFAKKAKMLRKVFFSTSLSIDLTDIKSSFYSTSISCSLIITEREMKKTLKWLALDKISSFDEISFRILRACFKTLTIILISLFQSCIELSYHSNVFKMINTITIKKLEKDDYIVLKVYRLIILLNTLDKTLKLIMSRKIFYLTKIYRLLLNTQMRVRKNRFIESVLELLTKQMHIVWDQNNDKMITLLSMNVTRVFDTMIHRKLIHNLQKRKISQWIVNWINSFLVDRRITLVILRIVIDQFSMQTSISQEFSLSLLLYLFYAAFDLRFVDDVNILAYEKSIEENCKSLKIIHRVCEKWAIRHEIVFASTKYELIHLTRNSKRFNMIITINIDFITIFSKIDIRVLRLQINIKLKWRSHVRKIQKKMIDQFMILSKILISTWNAIFAKIK